ncbi:MAG: response regulator receiver protein [Bacteroidota bacterium]|nr:response regulator receiver protein [Bacteroidota bacterium]
MKKIETIFVVDDDIDDREIFIEAINTVDSSIRCFTAIDGEDALVKAASKDFVVPEIIFLDLNMPKMDGPQFLAELKRNKLLGDIPVVIYSTSFRKTDVDETKRLGASYFLAKPSDFKELCDALSAIIKPGASAS